MRRYIKMRIDIRSLNDTMLLCQGDSFRRIKLFRRLICRFFCLKQRKARARACSGLNIKSVLGNFPGFSSSEASFKKGAKMVGISVWPMWCWLQDEDPCKTDTRHMEAKHEESPKCKRVKTGSKIRGNHENIAPSLWSKYCRLMDDVRAPSKVRRSMNIESWSVWLVLRSQGWTSSWLCLCKKKVTCLCHNKLNLKRRL